MPSQDPTYPAKRTPSPGGEFTIQQFFLPIRLNGIEVWALLDTGAHVSILPQEISNEILNRYNRPTDEGTYPLARLVSVPYESYELSFELLQHIDDTIPELDIMPYTKNPGVVTRIQSVEFQVPTLTWNEIASHLDPGDPIQTDGTNPQYVILGLYGVIDQLSLSFVGDNSVTVSTISPK